MCSISNLKHISKYDSSRIHFAGFVVFLFLFFINSTIAEVLYYEDFTGPSSLNLHGVEPDIDLSGGNSWIGHESWKADGTSGQFSSATLPFVPEQGYIYRLSVTMNQVIGNDYWIALGYTAGTSTSSGSNGDRFTDTTTAGSPWVLRRGNTSDLDDHFFIGPGAINGIALDTLDRSEDVSFQILLNTQNTNWNVTLKQKLASDSDYRIVHTRSYYENPLITAVGLANGNTAVTAKFQDFLFERIQPSLSIIPDGQPVDATVEGGQTQAFVVKFTSTSMPTIDWHCIKDSVDQLVDPDPGDHDISIVTLVTGHDEYESTLSINNTSVFDDGYYYCVLNNGDNFLIESNLALLKVNGMISHWPLNAIEYTVGQYQDIRGQYDATVIGIPTFTIGKDNSPDAAIEITPQDGYAAASDVPVISGETGAFSLSLWCRWNGDWAQQSAASTIVLENMWGGTHYLEGQIETAGQWQHICVTFDGILSKIYLDGMLRMTQSWQSPSNEKFTLEIGNMSGGQTFNGAIDDIRIYNYALNDSQVDSIYSMQGDCTLSYASEMDFSGPNGTPDCIVNLYDLVKFMENWMSCGKYPACK